MARKENPYSVAFRQALIVGAISLAIVAAAHPLFILIGNKTELFDYSPLRFILGSLFGWLLGVGNFLAMGISLIMLTEVSTDRTEGQKRAQASYMGRLVVVLILCVGGCFIPCFHPAAILISLALTQLGIFVYAFSAKMKSDREEASVQAPEATESAEQNEANEASGTSEADSDN